MFVILLEKRCCKFLFKMEVNYKPKVQDRTAVNHLLKWLPRLKKSNKRKAPMVISKLLDLPHEEIAFILAAFFFKCINPATEKPYCFRICFWHFQGYFLWLIQHDFLLWENLERKNYDFWKSTYEIYCRMVYNWMRIYWILS